MNPVEICKMLKTNMLTSPLKRCAASVFTFCLCWTTVVGDNSLSEMRIYARRFVQCYRAHYV